MSKVRERQFKRVERRLYQAFREFNDALLKLMELRVSIPKRVPGSVEAIEELARKGDLVVSDLGEDIVRHYYDEVAPDEIH